MRLATAVAIAFTLALGSLATPAQEPCSSAPACPGDGAVPTGDLIPHCSCPAPNSCGEPAEYRCSLAPGFIGALEWSCECVPESTEPPTPDPLPDPGFCGGIICPDGSPALPEPPTPSAPSGGQCTCKPSSPSDGMCTGHCANGLAPKAVGAHCACPDETTHCSDHICKDGKPPMITTVGECVCDDGELAPPILVPE